MAVPSIPSPGKLGSGVVVPSVKWAKDQLIRKTTWIAKTIIQAYMGKFTYIQLVDTDPIVGGTVLQLYNMWGILNIDDTVSTSTVVGLSLQKGMLTYGNGISIPRDGSNVAVIFTESTSSEEYLKAVRDSANEYSLYLKKNGAWHEVAANAGCRVFRTAVQSIPDATWTAINFTAELRDTDLIHSTSSNATRLTCKTAGLYTIFGHIEFAEDDPAVGYRAVAIKNNGSTYIAKADKEACNINPSFSINTLWDMAVNDYVELFVYQSAGHALDVNVQNYWSPHFGMHRID